MISKRKAVEEMALAMEAVGLDKEATSLRAKYDAIARDEDFYAAKAERKQKRIKKRRVRKAKQRAERRKNRAVNPNEKRRKTSNKNRSRKAFYKTAEWHKLRYDVLKEHGVRCECCGRSPSDGAVMNVDHIKPVSKYPELKLDKTNLQVLCSSCNYGKGARDQTDWRKRGGV